MLYVMKERSLEVFLYTTITTNTPTNFNTVYKNTIISQLFLQFYYWGFYSFTTEDAKVLFLQPAQIFSKSNLPNSMYVCVFCKQVHWENS